MNLINLFINAILVENVVLTKFLGLCPFLGTSNNKKNAISMGFAVMIVVSLSSILTYTIYYLILKPTNSTYLTNILFVFIIASLVQIIEFYLKKKNNKLYNSLGIYLPLITTNCAVLGITLLNITNDFNFFQMLFYSIGSSLGFTLVLVLFASLREEIAKNSGGGAFEGIPLALITISIMALLFERFALS